MQASTLTDQLFDAVRDAQMERIRELVALGADINSTNDEGFTPLVLACTHPDIRRAGSLISCLLEEGADVNKCDHSGYTPLFIAVLAKRLGIVQTLLERGANPNINFFPNHTPKVVSSALDLVHKRYLNAVIKEKKGLYDDFGLLQDEIDGCRGLMLILTEAGARQYEKEFVPEYS